MCIRDRAQTGLDELMSRLDKKYSSLLKWPFAAWWIEMKTEFFAFAKIALPLSLLLAILSQALIIGLNHYKHRGVILGGKEMCIRDSHFDSENTMVCLLLVPPMGVFDKMLLRLRRYNYRPLSLMCNKLPLVN